jgi:hypothetical protein
MIKTSASTDSGVTVLRSLDRMADETANRPVRTRSLDVIDYKPRDSRPSTHLAFEGTVTLLAARPGSALMAEIRQALASKSADTAELATRLYSQYRGRKRLGLRRATKIAAAQPILVDVAHGGLLRLENLFVPDDMEVAIVPLPYNGGKLAGRGLVILEHPISEDVEPLDVIALQHRPDLTEAERAALDRVPPEQAALNVGRGLGDQACSVVILTVAVVVEVAIVVVTFTITGGVSLEHMEHLTNEQLRELGPAPAARTLVQKRREILMSRKKARA